MNSKLIYFLLAAAILVIISIFAINDMENVAEQKALAENKTKLQLEYINNLQAKSERILAADYGAQELLKGKTSYKVYEVIHNESVVEIIYLVDFQPEKLKYGGKGFKMVNGTICRFYIDLKTKTVQIEENNDQNSFDCDSGLLVMTSNIHKEGVDINLDSSMSLNIWPPAWYSLPQNWRYGFKIEGRENIKPISDSSKARRLNYQLKIRKMNGVESISLSSLYFGDKLADVLSGNESVSTKYWTDERKRDEHTLKMSLTEKNSFPIDYFYIWDVKSDSDRTILFDVDLVVAGLNKTTDPEELYGWRFIIKTPPNLDYMSEDDMMKLGFWAANDYGSYYPISCTIVRKGNWLENVTA